MDEFLYIGKPLQVEEGAFDESYTWRRTTKKSCKKAGCNTILSIHSQGEGGMCSRCTRIARRNSLFERVSPEPDQRQKKISRSKCVIPSDTIIRLICEVFAIAKEDLQKKRSSDESITHAKCVAAYLLSADSHLSHAKISQEFGGSIGTTQVARNKNCALENLANPESLMAKKIAQIRMRYANHS